MKEITGKKRIIVDDSIFLDLVRDNNGQPAGGLSTALGGKYFPSEYNAKDTLRVAIGKHWDYDFTDVTGPTVGGQKLLKGPAPLGSETSYTNPKINVFCNSPLEYEECADQGNTDEDGSWLGYNKEQIVIKCKVENQLFKQAFDTISDDPGTPEDSNINDLFFWSYLMQYGIITPTGQTLQPIVKTYTDFFDHYHEAMAPYTPAELANQSPAGKAFFVDYDSFYNNRASSIDYESFVGGTDNYQNCLPNIYGFAKIVNNEELSQGQFFNLNEMIDGGTDGTNTYVPGVTLKKFYHTLEESTGLAAGKFERIRNNTYRDLFKYYPLEASLLLYGAMAGLDREMSYIYSPTGQTVYTTVKNPLTDDISLQQMLKLDAKKVDASGVFKKWFKNFKQTLQDDPAFAAVPVTQTGRYAGRYGVNANTKLGSLEFINSNIVFSPHSAVSLMKKAEQYKNYFPMYFEMNFTAQLTTTIGDDIKNLKLGKFLSDKIVATHRPYGVGTAPFWDKFDQDSSTSLPFVDFMESRIYETLFDPADPISGKAVFITVPSLDAPAYLSNSKKTIDFLGAIDSWLGNQDYSSMNSHYLLDTAHLEEAQDLGIEEEGIAQATPKDGWYEDVRNFTTYVRSDIDEPASLGDDCNVLFKVLGGSAFKQKIIDTYKQKARTYKDIISGVPAYAEELFYVIKKFRQSTYSAGEEEVQNIVIPNNSDLDIVNYIDTQVKYGKDTTYRYEVYAHRLVFGSRYRYEFRENAAFKNEDSVSPIDSNGSMDNLITAQQHDDSNGATLNHNETCWHDASGYTATYKVKVYPSIQLIADKIFSTGPVRILDDPPVPPHVNVVPFRAVNNKIRILLSGQSDTFRAEPVIMLDGDSLSFNEVKESQFSFDGKVRFSSDDRISGFEAFRIEQRPHSYGEFEMHPSQEINNRIANSGGTAVIDDLIFPNKKYYYTFRARDNHGHVSNPTPVYEVELIDEKGAVKPIIRTISMDKKENNLSTKECQKYILLKPSDKQISFSDNPDVNSVFSSIIKTDAKKKYKMRLTSKGTGKKIDINFVFFKKFTDD